MPKNALSHSENRNKVCFLCFKKHNKQMFVIKNQLKVDMQDLVDNYSDEDNLPAALCCTCKRYVYAAKAGGNKIKNPDLTQFSLLKSTRSKCKCKICEIARSKPESFLGKNGTGTTGKYCVHL